MKRGSKCIARTINLSNPETCIRPKRIQKLVDAGAMQPCPSHVGTGTSYWTPRPVAIKICTWKDMRRTCPPKLCDCSQKAASKTASQRLCKALLFLLKSSVAAGLVYWTNAEGLWGSSDDAEDLYYRLMGTIAAIFSDNYDGDQIELPRVGEFKYRMVKAYNSAVFAVTNCIVDMSVKLREHFRHVVCPQEEEQQSEESSDSSANAEDST